MIACVALIGCLVALDQHLKIWAIAALQTGDIVLIPNVLILHYAANTGAAFSILQGRVEILAAISGTLVVVGFYLLFFQSRGSRLLRFAFSLMIAGGIGNLIDRAFRGYVVDYLYFKPINFPVFNLADSCVSVGVALLAVYVLFIYKDPAKMNAVGSAGTAIGGAIVTAQPVNGGAGATKLASPLLDLAREPARQIGDYLSEEMLPDATSPSSELPPADSVPGGNAP